MYLPGLGPTTGGALILPFTMTLDPLSAIVLLTSIYCAGTYGGAITAVLINTPGTPAAAATCLDGYPLAQKGEAGRALGMATVKLAEEERELAMRDERIGDLELKLKAQEKGFKDKMTYLNQLVAKYKRQAEESAAPKRRIPPA